MTLSPVTADVGTIRPLDPRGPAAAGVYPGAAPRPEGTGAAGPGGAPAVGVPVLPGAVPEAVPGLVDAVRSGDVPPGADPQAWLGLTIEERSYFAGLANDGRLSYGPQDRAGESPLFRGRYLNIRV
jgi:hypothetical protein